MGPINWLGSIRGAMASILIIDTWGNLPFVSLILLGGLQSLPGEPYEAARVDGASPRAILRHITLPLLSPFIVLAITFRTMDALRIFDVIYATTVGGPADATTNLHMLAFQYRSVVPDGQGHGARGSCWSSWSSRECRAAALLEFAAALPAPPA